MNLPPGCSPIHYALLSSALLVYAAALRPSYARCPDLAKILMNSRGASPISPSCVSPLPFNVRALTMFTYAPMWNLQRFRRKGTRPSAKESALLCGLLLAAIAPTGFFSSPVQAQQTDSAASVVVQPGAPGQPSRKLPPSTKGTLPPRSQADIEFMQGMIMHHAQAVEMTALIPSHTRDKAICTLGERISLSQADEIKFLKRWLVVRNAPVSMAMPGMSDIDNSCEPMP